MCDIITKAMESEINNLGYFILLKSIPDHFLENIRRNLYVKPIENANFGGGADTSFPVFRISKTKVYLPRYYGITVYGPPKRNTITDGSMVNLKFEGTLREIQQTTIDETLKTFEEFGGGLISLDTGLGKTVVALKLIELIKVKTLIIVHAEFLLEQWKARIKQYLPDAKIGVIQQDLCQTSDVDITIAMIQTLVKREYPKGTFDTFGMMQIDECLPGHQTIKTSQGKKQIKEIYDLWKTNQELPLILSYNEITEKTEYKRITYAWKKENKNLLRIFIFDFYFECTENHKILTSYGYKEACKLELLDLIISETGLVKITNIQKVYYNDSDVYDIEVEDNHNFICSDLMTNIGIVAHNCHHVAAKSFSSLFYKVQTKYLLGRSATPERKDGLSKVIYWFLGPQIISIKREMDKPKVTFLMNNVINYEEKYNRLGKINNPTMITDLTLKKERNLLIITTIEKLLKESRKILVLSDRRQHCEFLEAQLKDLSISCGVYLGGMKTVERETTVNCSVILGTYQASGEGFDVPELDTLILATPKSDVQQAIGRILRQKNKNEPIIIDIVDSFSIFKGSYYKRRKFYKLSNIEMN